MGVAFTEIKRFQVKPDKTEEFERLIKTAKAEQAVQPGCLSVRYLKRFYTLDDMTPRELTRVIKCVKYFSYWEFDDIANYTNAIRWFFEKYEKAICRLLIMPFDIYMGDALE